MFTVNSQTVSNYEDIEQNQEFFYITRTKPVFH